MHSLQKQLRKLSDTDLHQATISHAKQEQTATLDLLFHLFEVKRRRLFGIFGFPTLWEYTRSLGYSESGTNERIRAMELLEIEPAVVEAKLKSNALTLTTASQIQTFLRKLEKHTHAEIPHADKMTLIEEASLKSKAEVEAILISKTPNELRPRFFEEKIRVISPELKEVRFGMDPELEALLCRYRELKGRLGIQEVLKNTLNESLDRHDPLRKADSANSPTHTTARNSQSGTTSTPSRHVPAATRRLVFKRAQGQCEYIAPDGRRCLSRYRLEVDHVVLYAISRDHSPSNLRALCPTHNKIHAIQSLGWKKMEPFLRY